MDMQRTDDCWVMKQEVFVKIDSLNALFQEELKDIYDAEKRLVRALPKMAKAASAAELRQALEEHLEVTKGQVQRLEQVFELLGVPAKAKACAGMKGLIEEGEEVMGEDASEKLMDAAIIGAAQRVEHYEIAAYGTARTFAERLGNGEVAALLEETLNEEKEADEKLTDISEQLLEGMEDAEGTPAGGKTSRKSAGSRRTRTSRA
jgi:ferritin-like metal-binding protein YciE